MGLLRLFGRGFEPFQHTGRPGSQNIWSGSRYSFFLKIHRIQGAHLLTCRTLEKGHWFDTGGSANTSPGVDGSLCGKIHSFLSDDYCFYDGNVGKQPVP